MGRFVEGADRSQRSFLPECLEDWVDADNPVQVIDAFVEALDLLALGFDGATAGEHGSASVPSGRATQALHLRIPEPRAVEPTARA